MIQITDKARCCGCSACEQICPRGCISMEKDSEGFFYPRVDQTSCIGCNLCNQVCPLEQHRAKTGLPEAAAAQALDETVLKNSSSGGVFSLLAEEILDRGGAVYGAAFDDRWGVQHLRIREKDQLHLLRGSKYTQSRISGTFRRVREDLKAGIPVLFVGTGCQAAGLRQYLGRDYDQLYIADILCHGVPSPMVWEKYLAWQEKRHGNRKTEEVFMRDKSTGWKSYGIRMGFSGGKRYLRRFSWDAYMKVFLEDLCLRPSCYECQYKTLDRDSDLTLGDAWGAERLFPDLNTGGGVSAVLIHSERGRRLLASVQHRLTVRPADAEALLPPDSGSRKKLSVPAEREAFFREITGKNWEKAFSRREWRCRAAMVKYQIRKALSGSGR